jgi:hypothetical protein
MDAFLGSLFWVMSFASLDQVNAHHINDTFEDLNQFNSKKQYYSTI